MRMRRAILILSAAVSVLAACERARPLLSEEKEITARQLTGTWDMQFTLEQSPIITLDVAKAPRMITGKISLLANTSLHQSFNRIGIPTNYGSYDIDLTPFGFDPRPDGETPTAVAGRLSHDSIEIIFSPRRGSERLVLKGKIQRSSVEGAWRVSLPTSGGGGSFRLTRSAASAN